MVSPVSTIHLVRASSRARVTKYAASTIRKVIIASGSLNRNISTATGVSASAAPAMKPAAGPNQRRTVRNSNQTEPTPISACGTSIDQELKPKIRPAISIGHRNAGGLSTVMKLDESNEPKKNAFQLFVPACTAAA